MPTLDLTTNVKLADPKAFALDFSKFSADTLSKPELYISVKITYNENLTFGGTFEPAFQLTIVSLDNIDVELNERYSEAFFDFFKEKLNVPGDRGYINFHDPGRGFLGHQGTTFASIFGKK